MLPLQAGLLLSGGEDAKLNVWSSPVHFSQIEGNDHADMDVDLPEKRDFDDKEQNVIFHLTKSFLHADAGFADIGAKEGTCRMIA